MKVTDDGEAETFYVASTWVILSPKASFFQHAIFRDAAVTPIETSPDSAPGPTIIATSFKPSPVSLRGCSSS